MDLDSIWKPANDPDLFGQSLEDINLLHNIGHGGMSTPTADHHHHHHHPPPHDMQFLYNPSCSEQRAKVVEDKEEELVEVGDAYHNKATTTLSWYNDSNIGTRPLSLEHMGHLSLTIPSHDHHSLNYNYVTYNGDHHHHHHHHDNAAFQYDMAGSSLSPMPPSNGHLISKFTGCEKSSVMNRGSEEDARTITMTGVGPPETMVERAHLGHNAHVLVKPNIKSCGSRSDLLISKGTQYNSCDDLSDTNHQHHEDDDHDWDNHLHYTDDTTTNTTITTTTTVVVVVIVLCPRLPRPPHSTISLPEEE